jgi:hypothetical protein
LTKVIELEHVAKFGNKKATPLPMPKVEAALMLPQVKKPHQYDRG